MVDKKSYIIKSRTSTWWVVWRLILFYLLMH